MSNRRWPKVVAAVASAAILAVTAVGAGVTSVLGQLEGNITALDVSDQTGISVNSTESVVVDEATGETEPFDVLIMGSDSRVGKGRFSDVLVADDNDHRHLRRRGEGAAYSVLDHRGAVRPRSAGGWDHGGDRR